MKPLKIWITRPNASEVYLGGMRHVNMHVSKPCYSHGPRCTDLKWPSGLFRFTDRGWGESFHAKEFLKQDSELYERVWDYVFWSVAPKGMDMKKAEQWCISQDPNREDSEDTLWRTIYADRDWEQKCNLNHKRFLLEVDLRSNDAEIVVPSVVYRDRRPSEDTQEIDQVLALEYYHPEGDPNSNIPF